MRKINNAMGFGLFVAGAALGVFASHTLFAQSPGGLPSTKMILRTDLQNIPGQEVMVFTSDWAPGTRLPLHMHPNGHEFVFVIEGEQTFEIEGLGQKIVKAGEVLYTSPNVPHYGRNATDKLSRTVVFRVKDKSEPVSVELNK
jgi:quercetin dioxygenase-like cupin family protein